MSSEQADAEERDEHEQRLANRRWEPLLKKWKTWLGDRRFVLVPSHGGPGAVGVPDRSPGGPLDPQGFLHQGFGSRADLPVAIARPDRRSPILAGRGRPGRVTRSESVRQAAIAILKKRPRRDYAGQLVEMIRGKIRHTVRPVDGPGSTGTLILDTPRIRMILTYDTPAVFQPASSFRGYAGYDANGLPVIVQGRELDRGIIGPTKLHEIEVRTAGPDRHGQPQGAGRAAADGRRPQRGRDGQRAGGGRATRGSPRCSRWPRARLRT